jgi:hypothetical protein
VPPTRVISDSWQLVVSVFVRRLLPGGGLFRGAYEPVNHRLRGFSLPAVRGCACSFG